MSSLCACEELFGQVFQKVTGVAAAWTNRRLPRRYFKINVRMWLDRVVQLYSKR